MLPLILASASEARRRLLEAAGLEIGLRPAAIDESEIKESYRAEGASPAEVANALAELKGFKVSAMLPEAFVIAADQMLDLEGSWFDKPGDIPDAKDHLRRLSGKTHRLLSAAVVMQGGQRLWHRLDHATLTVRPLSEDFIDWYCAAAGESILQSVGAYRIEGLGAQLFEQVRGDHFTIQGLPLLPLLSFLRLHGYLKA